ncbi:MAG: sulfatase [Planctomycetota bacterium]
MSELRSILCTLAACALVALGCSSQEQGSGDGRDAPPLARPNVLLVLVDDLGWSDLGCYGNPAVDTPRIDAFCAESLRFTDAYSAAPVCSPTRAAIMTGLAPARVRITNHMPDRPSFSPDDAPLQPAECRDRLALEYDTLAERLSRAGYRTAFMGKWHLAPADQPDEAEYFPDRQGFDLNLGGNGWGGPGRSFFAPYSFPNLESKTEDEYLPYRIGDEAVAWLDERAGDEEPFFLALWHYTVHWPMDSPADLLAKYEARGVQPGIVDPRYAGMTEALDRVFGRVMDALERSGHADDTLVIFSSDNGALGSVADNRPLRAAKGFLYEGGIRVPTMMRWPGVVAPGSSATPIVSTDFFATILDAAGVAVAPDEPMDGESLVPLLRGHAFERGPLYFHYPNYAFHRANRLGGAIRAGDFKLIERFDDGSLELYDVVNDLGETANLASERAELAEELRAKLAAWRERVDAAMPTRNR